MTNLFFFLKANPILLYSLTIVFALTVGSVLCMITYRLPIMLFKTWRSQCELLLSEAQKSPTIPSPFNLFFPRSHCPHCQTTLTLWQLIPIASFLLQRGKCHHCQHPIGRRYLLLELLTVILTLLVAIRFGFTFQSGMYMLFTWLLLAITWIDFEHHIIPDELNFILLWLGLLLSLHPHFITIQQALGGIIGGYLFLWTIGHLYHLLRKQEGIGYGDYKLFAALGAWLGWQSLPMVLLIAACLGSLIGGGMMLLKKRPATQAQAFGPYLAIAGWCMMMWHSGFYFP